MNSKYYIYILLCTLIQFSCNKKSISPQYSDQLISENLDGNLKDMFINGDSLFILSDRDGLITYSLLIEQDSLKLDAIFSSSSYFESYDFRYNFGIHYSEILDKIILHDFNSIYQTSLEGLFANTNLKKMDSFPNNAHPYEISVIEDQNQIDVYALVRFKSDIVQSDVASIYKLDIPGPNSSFYGEEIGLILEIEDSLNYYSTDIVFDKRLFVSNVDSDQNKINVYSKNIKTISYNGECSDLSGNVITVPFPSDVIGKECLYYSIDSFIETPLKPNALFLKNDLLFIGLDDHGGIQVYDSETLSLLYWFSQGFSIKDINWDNDSNILLLSCGYQGVVIIKFDGNTVHNNWIFTTSYAYSAVYYENYVIVSTKNGIEYIRLNE